MWYRALFGLRLFYDNVTERSMKMTMPIDLVLVRHGESEGNVATRLSAQHGDESVFATEFAQRPGSQWRLTDLGASQAEVAGKWILENIGSNFDRYCVSEYVRAKETAGLLGLPGATWFSDLFLRERDWGDAEAISRSERMARYAESMKRRETEGFYWSPPNGESLAHLCLRIDRAIQTWHRECCEKRVIAVCHGEVMWAFRVRLERMSQRRFRELEISRNPYDKIHNCQILHYTRKDPVGGSIAPHYMWMRSVCPGDLRVSSNNWTGIERPRSTNEDLLAEVARFPRLIR